VKFLNDDGLRKLLVDIKSRLSGKQNKLIASTNGFLVTHSGTEGQEGTPTSPYSFMRNLSGLTAGVNGTLLDTVNAATANAVAGQGNTITLFSIAGADWTAFTDLPADLTGLSTTSYLRVLVNRLNTNQVEVIINIWGNNNQYKRSTYSNGTWAGSWVKLATTADLDSYAGVNRTLISTSAFTTLLDLMKDQQPTVGIKTVFLTNIVFNALTDIPTDITFSSEYKTATIIRGATNNITIEVTTWYAGSNYTWRRTTINDGTWGTSVWKRLATSADVDAAQFAVNIPDYANMETTNRITANNGSWTVTQNGFVVCTSQADFADASTNNGSFQIFINNKLIHRAGRFNTGWNQVISEVPPIPVKAGDVVRIAWQSTTGISNDVYACYFIPPVKIQAPIITPSTTEADTGKKWFNGKKIYCRAFTGEVITEANTDTTISLLSGVYAVTHFDGYLIEPNGNKINIGQTRPGFVNKNDISVGSNCINLKLNTQFAWESGYSYELVIEYTKV